MDSKKFKVIAVSNFDDETIDDVLLCENIDIELYGHKIVRMMNDQYSNSCSLYFYELVDQNYVLHKFEP